jgi:exodeoxyribonuclease VII small subunit
MKRKILKRRGFYLSGPLTGGKRSGKVRDMSKSPRDDLPGELTFEKALAELERIVNRMEAGELSLEQALASHKRGLELAKFCQARLETAQQQVRVLEGDVLKPLAAAAAADDEDE